MGETRGSNKLTKIERGSIQWLCGIIDSRPVDTLNVVRHLSAIPSKTQPGSNRRAGKFYPAPMELKGKRYFSNWSRWVYRLSSCGALVRAGAQVVALANTTPSTSGDGWKGLRFKDQIDVQTAIFATLFLRRFDPGALT